MVKQQPLAGYKDYNSLLFVPSPLICFQIEIAKPVSSYYTGFSLSHCGGGIAKTLLFFLSRPTWLYANYMQMKKPLPG